MQQTDKTYYLILFHLIFRINKRFVDTVTTQIEKHNARMKELFKLQIDSDSILQEKLVEFIRIYEIRAI